MHQFMRISTISQSIIDNKEKHKLQFYFSHKKILLAISYLLKEYKLFFKKIPLNSFLDSLDRCDSDISNALYFLGR